MKKQFCLIVLILIALKSFTQDLSVITSNLPSNTNSILLSGDIDDGLMDVFVSGNNPAGADMPVCRQVDCSGDKVKA
jgi:hypothetical protein